MSSFGPPATYTQSTAAAVPSSVTYPVSADETSITADSIFYTADEISYTVYSPTNLNALRLNPLYFGPGPQYMFLDLTEMVNAADGIRRNLPQIQFRINTPLGIRDYITYRDSLGPPSGINGQPD